MPATTPHYLPHTRIPTLVFPVSGAASKYVAREIDKLIRYQTDDPLLSTMISVTGVEATQDLQKAKVYVSFLEEEHEAKGKMVRRAVPTTLKGLMDQDLELVMAIVMAWMDAVAGRAAVTVDEALLPMEISNP